MIWVVLAILLGLVALCAMFGGFIGIIVGSDEGNGLAWAGAALAVVILTLSGVGCVKSAVAASRHYGTHGCTSFADQTGYEVRYLVTTVFDGGTCYVRFGGNWVPKDQLWAELGGRS